MGQKNLQLDTKLSVFIKRKKKRRPKAEEGAETADKFSCDLANSNSIDHKNTRRHFAILNNSSDGMAKRRVIIKSFLSHCLVLLVVGLVSPPAGCVSGPTSASSRHPTEYQLIGQARTSTRLPCLIGKKVYCGEPYFIAWYKFNSTTRGWLRIESSSDEPQQQEDYEQKPSWLANSNLDSRPLNDRVHFIRNDQEDPSEQQQPTKKNRKSFAGAPPLQCFSDQQAAAATPTSRQFLLNSIGQFDCAQLNIDALELQDEGQYKCEITFSDSLDAERCPSSTVTQLVVVARPNEPEILVNGRAAIAQQQQQLASTGSSASALQFKEGAQVRLECQSAGGKPAPRIDWLNLSLPVGGEGRPELHSMRAVQQQQQQLAKRGSQQQSILSYSQSTTSGSSAAVSPVSSRSEPITSSSMTIQLSRHDLQSQFICLVLPQQQQQSKSDQNYPAIPDEWRNAASLAKMLDKIPMLANARGSKSGDVEPMLKWIGFDVLAKPSSVSLSVRDLVSQTPVQPIGLNWPKPASDDPSGSFQQQTSSSSATTNRFYSLQPNRVYAIQCLVENSRPRSQVTWFNRTAQVEVETVQLESSDYLAPDQPGQHRLTSFVRYARQDNGLVSTIASLLVTPNYYDKFEEFFCRISNDAFQFDELAQVAPILSAKIYVNFPLSSWIDSPSANLNWTQTSGGARPSSSAATLIARLGAKLNDELQLRCNVAANPLNQNAILQIDWLKDGRVLAPTTTTTTTTNNNSRQPTGGRLRIEKTNHLHMPHVAGQSSDDLDWPSQVHSVNLLAGHDQVAAAKLRPSAGKQPASLSWPPTLANNRLLASSQLTLSRLAKSDAGLYSCQFKLIPTPSEQQQANSFAATNNRLQQSSKIVSGQTNQSVHLELLESQDNPTTTTRPVVRVSSSQALLVYDKIWSSREAERARDELGDGGQVSTIVLAKPKQTDPVLSVSLQCDLGQANQQQQPFEFGHKVIWYLNGLFLYSSSESDTYNISLASESGRQLLGLLLEGGTVGCAHHLLATNPPQTTSDPASAREQLSLAAEFYAANSIRVFQSSNRVRFLLEVKPKLLNRRDLMPLIRSFDRQELLNLLSAKQTAANGKFQSTCLAQCEPAVCSIDWYLNGAKLIEKSNQIWEQTKVTRTNNETLVLIESSKQFHLINLMQPQPILQSERLIQLKQNSSRFSWLKQTSLFMPFDSHVVGGHSQAADETWTRQLGSGSSSSSDGQQQANVVSRLELNYELLLMLSDDGATSGRQQDRQLTLECRLDANQPNRRGVGQGAQDELNSSAFGFIRAKPFDWIPSAGQSSLSQLGVNVTFDGAADGALSPLDGLNSLKTTIKLLDSFRVGPLNGSIAAPNNLSMAELIDPNRSSGHQQSADQQQQQHELQRQAATSLAPVLRQWISSKFHWLLVGICLVASIWLITMFGSAYIKRHYYCPSGGSGGNCGNNIAALYGLPTKCNGSAKGKPNKKTKKKKNRTSMWHFNSNHDHHMSLSRASSTTNVELPFGQLTKHSSNYYGGGANSNGGDSSEHDMIQSCSQSSHYEDFIQHQLQLQQQQQQQSRQQQLAIATTQPIYFNHHQQQQHPIGSTTLNPSQRPLMMKLSSLSSSSTCGETLSNTSAGQLKKRANPFYQQHTTTRKQQQLDSFGNSYGSMANNNLDQQTRNVPLIDGDRSKSSRIRLDDCNQQQNPYSRQPIYSDRQQQTHLQEHIYDDVIYNQMIL